MINIGSAMIMSMIRMLLPVSLCFFIAGCDDSLMHIKRFKWATVNESDIQSAVREEFKKNNPYPESIRSNIDDMTHDRRKLQIKIAEMESIWKRKCRASSLLDIESGDKKSSVNQEENVNKLSGGVDGFSSEPNIITSTTVRLETKVESSASYQDCMSGAKSDTLMVDLRDKLEVLDKAYDVKEKHDDDVRKKLENTIDLAISDYAEENGFELIIASRSNGNIVYSKNKIVVDVTADIVDYLQKDIAKTLQAK